MKRTSTSVRSLRTRGRFPRARLPLRIIALAVIVLQSPFQTARSEDQGITITPGGSAPPASSADELWQVIYLDRQRIGYSRTRSEPVVAARRRMIRTTTEMHLTVKRFGETTRLQFAGTADETEDGDLLAFTFETRTGFGSPSRTTGRADEGRMLIETSVAGRRDKRAVTLPAGTKSPFYQDRIIRHFPMRPGEVRRFDVFVPEQGEVSSVRLAADERRRIKLLDGTSRMLLKVRVAQSAEPEAPVYAWLDEKGVPLVIETEMIGTPMLHYTVPKEEALKAIAGTELDLGISSLIPVNAVRGEHRTRKAIYRITLPGSDPAAYLPAGSTQRLRRIDAETVELTVIRIELPTRGKRRTPPLTKGGPGGVESRPASEPPPAPPYKGGEPRPSPEYTSPTSLLQSRDRRVVAHANRAVGRDADPMRTAVAMERYVHEKLKNKNFSTALASAAEVADGLEGDCTEHAVLLAAMLRTRGIPSRIAVGLVYIPNLSCFGGHMWTEAFLGGRWVPLDATLGQGGIGAAHIKLADSSFADDSPATIFLPLMNVLGRMQIKVIEAE